MVLSIVVGLQLLLDIHWFAVEDLLHDLAAQINLQVERDAVKGNLMSKSSFDLLCIVFVGLSNAEPDGLTRALIRGEKTLVLFGMCLLQ